MRFTSKIKTNFKSAYKSVKKEINTFLQKLGLKKTAVTELSTKIFDNMDEILASYINSGINDELDNEALEPIFVLNDPPDKNNSEHEQAYANEYKKVFNEVNTFFTKEKQTLKIKNSKLNTTQEEEETYSR